jgi:cation transport ATPase
MRRAGFVVLAGAMIAAGAAAQAPTREQTPANSSAPGPAEPRTAALPNGTAVNAEMNSSVDSKKVKVGDRVEAHTTEAVKYDGKVIVRKERSWRGTSRKQRRDQRGIAGPHWRFNLTR